MAFWMWAVVCLLLLAILWQWLNPSLVPVLRWQPEALNGEYWRLLSGHFVHLGTTHGLLNVVALLLVWRLFVTDWSPQDPLLMLLSLPFTGLLLLVSDLTWYVGFSAVLHGWFLLGALRVWPVQRYFSAVMLVLLLAKLVWEPNNPAAAAEVELIGGPIAYVAHQAGVVAMILLFACWGLWDKVRR